ncbi:hypothetical protein JYT71_00695 [Acidimicrobiaceae bacterium AH-315-P05]|nr:hypothetical protein [Acidimicrobiaceae bacterium AH-315-P05]
MSTAAPLKRLLLRSSIVAGIAVGAVATSATGIPGQTVAPVVEGQIAGLTIERATAVAAAPTFSATANPAIVIPDPSGIDVGMPMQFPADRISGYDIEQVVVVYDDVTDALSITIDTYVIAGDADGDGDPDTTGPVLNNLGGLDEPNFESGESFAILIDVDQDGAFDVIAGVNTDGDLSSFQVAKHSSSGFSTVPFLPLAYGAPLPAHNGGGPGAPSAASPALTMTIADFSQLATTLGVTDDSLDFGVNAFMGSFSDAGIGEDFVPSRGGSVNVDLDARIGDYVWIDKNLNGQQDSGEPPAAGIGVDLLDSGGAIIDSTTTDPNGLYEFIVRPGTYAVGFNLPTAASFTTQGVGSPTDSDADTATGITPNVVVAQGDSSLDLDAGLIIHDPDIHIEKATNGEDADVAPGPTLTSGSTATFTYVVTNTGNIALTDIEVTDDVLGAICTIDDLAVGASDRCEATSTVVPGPYFNLGTAEGVPVINNVELDPVSDTDPSNHRGTVVPKIDIEKATNGEDADAAPGPEIISGTDAIFTYVVTNTGNVPLSNIVVSDDVLGQICSITFLAVGTSDQCVANATVVPGPYENSGTATATPLLNGIALPDVSDTDLSHHNGSIDPGIDIEKATNGVDADTAPGPELNSGDAVTFTYVVTNLGNVPLVDVVVYDDKLGAVCTIDLLAVGAIDQCELVSVVQPGPYTNMGTAVGTPVVQGVQQQQIIDSDPSHHSGSFNPAIDIEKATNGEDADDAPGVSLVVGDGVRWTYIVNNVGNINLTEVVVTDDQLGQICAIGDLAVGASGQCNATGTVVEGQYTNVGSVTGLPVFPGFSFLPVSDIDPSNYTGVVPPPACVPNISGPLMWAGAIDQWDLGQEAVAGSLIRIVTHEPDSSPGQPNEQVYVQVGDDIYGPTPVGLGELAFTVVNAGPVRVVHYSVVTGDVSNPNSVAFTICGSELS